MKNELALRPGLDPERFIRQEFLGHRPTVALIEKCWELRLLRGCRHRVTVNLSPIEPGVVEILVMFPNFCPGSARADACAPIALSLTEIYWSRSRSVVMGYLLRQLFRRLLEVVRLPWPADYFGPYDPSGKPPKNDVY